MFAGTAFHRVPAPLHPWTLVSLSCYMTLDVFVKATTVAIAKAGANDAM